MGQKTNPISNRIGITRGWDSNWVGGNYAEKIAEAEGIRTIQCNSPGDCCLRRLDGANISYGIAVYHIAPAIHH